MSASEDHDDRGTAVGALEDRKQRRTPLPKLQLGIVFLIQFAEPVTALVVYPFVNQLVRKTGITGGDETKTGYYAGVIESTFFFSETATVLLWGWLSDVFGRRPVLLLGPLGLSVAMFGFGLSTTYWPLVFYRAFQGLFNGNIGVSKSIMAEITDSTNIGDAYALGPLMWNTGVTIGPTIGGVLSNAATRWPDTFGKFAFFHDYPYFLPCAAAGSISFLSFAISTIALKETLPVSRRYKLRDSWGRFVKRFKSKTDDSTTPLLAENQPSNGYGSAVLEYPPPVASELEERPRLSQLFVPSFIITLLNYGLLAFVDMAVAALVPLVYSTPIEYGGLGMDPFKIGIILGVFGLINGLISALFLGPFLRRYGPTKVFRTCVVAYFVPYIIFPITNTLARRAGRVDAYVIAAVMVHFASMSLASPCFASMGILIINTAPSRSLLGSANGAAQMVSSGSRVLAPAIASSLFSISIQRNLAGGHAVYYIFLVLTLIMNRASWYIPTETERAK